MKLPRGCRPEHQYYKRLLRDAKILSLIVKYEMNITSWHCDEKLRWAVNGTKGSGEGKTIHTAVRNAVKK